MQGVKIGLPEASIPTGADPLCPACRELASGLAPYSRPERRESGPEASADQPVPASTEPQSDGVQPT